MGTVKEILQLLLDVALAEDTNMAKPAACIIYDSTALETYYKLIVLCFRRWPGESNEHLSLHVIWPLEALIGSLKNECIMAKVLFRTSCRDNCWNS